MEAQPPQLQTEQHLRSFLQVLNMDSFELPKQASEDYKR